LTFVLQRYKKFFNLSANKGKAWQNRTTDAQHPPNVRVLFYNLSPTGHFSFASFFFVATKENEEENINM